MLKFGSWAKKDKWLFMLTVGAALCILAIPSGKKGSGMTLPGLKTGADTVGNSDKSMTKENAGEEKDLQPVSARVPDTYEQQLEARVKDILRCVDGVGTVDVMIVLKTSGEKVVHVDDSISHSVTEEKDTAGGSRKIESSEQERNAILTSADGGDSPIVEKEIRPEISGIIISASGGGNPAIKSEISGAMEALFDLPPNKIKVLKRME